MISDRVALRKWVLIVSAKRRRSSNKCESCLVESWLHRLSFDRWTTDSHVQMTCLLILVKLRKRGWFYKSSDENMGERGAGWTKILGINTKGRKGKGKVADIGWVAFSLWPFCMIILSNKCPVFLGNWLIQEELSVSINRIISALPDIQPGLKQCDRLSAP